MIEFYDLKLFTGSNHKFAGLRKKGFNLLTYTFCPMVYFNWHSKNEIVLIIKGY